MTINNPVFTNEDWETYVGLAAALVDLPIPAGSMAGVVETLATTYQVSRPLLEIDLPEGSEMAPIFKS